MPHVPHPYSIVICCQVLSLCHQSCIIDGHAASSHADDLFLAMCDFGDEIEQERQESALFFVWSYSESLPSVAPKNAMAPSHITAVALL